MKKNNIISEKSKNFWKKVKNCKHKNFEITDYKVNCPSAYCFGDEMHCKDCGAYIVNCECGFMNDISGWSLGRTIRYEKRKEKCVKKKLLQL